MRTTTEDSLRSMYQVGVRIDPRKQGPPPGVGRIKFSSVCIGLQYGFTFRSAFSHGRQSQQLR